MEEIVKELQKLSLKVTNLQMKIEELESTNHFEGWISRQALMEFFDYGETKMAELLKSEDLIVSEIGNRKFIKKESVVKFLENNIR